MKMRLTFAWKVFILYSLFFSTLILGIVLTVYFYISHSLTNSKTAEMEQTVKAISAQTDALLDRMNNLSQLFLFSNDVQDMLLDTLPYQNSDSNYFDLNLPERMQFKDTMLSIIGIRDIPRRVAVYNGKHTFVNYSITPRTDGMWIADLRTLPWIEQLNEKGGNELFLPPHADLWSTEREPVSVISFVRRLLYLKGGTTIGFLEIQQPSSLLDGIVKKSLPEGSRLTIRDGEGRIVYPYSKPDENDRPHASKKDGIPLRISGDPMDVRPFDLRRRSHEAGQARPADHRIRGRTPIFVYVNRHLFDYEFVNGADPNVKEVAGVRFPSIAVARIERSRLPERNHLVESRVQ
ncbi:cache domain-containing protein [Cohnella rhizosphaerae]|uniref:Cache domain-containing protein n=1 Tax=Cohnella rhizosphaerae TaxID=1457232 RepID=A0A9X4KYU1_9BACL|nr:cache domain-containing protein [Cohnella rhizosphaerae]MDG0813846.1 cache domain-containing protein [Cohnella rhizosphaerae]